MSTLRCSASRPIRAVRDALVVATILAGAMAGCASSGPRPAESAPSVSALDRSCGALAAAVDDALGASDVIATALAQTDEQRRSPLWQWILANAPSRAEAHRAVDMKGAANLRALTEGAARSLNAIVKKIGLNETYAEASAALASSLGQAAALCERPTPPGGHIDPKAIQLVVRASYARVHACYDAALARDASLKGRMSMRFKIDEAGRVSNVSTAGSDLRDAAAVECVADAFRALQFMPPRGVGVVTVVYPLIFSP